MYVLICAPISESTTDPDDDLHSEFSEPTDDVSNMTTLYVIIALCAVAVTLCICKFNYGVNFVHSCSYTCTCYCSSSWCYSSEGCVS